METKKKKWCFGNKKKNYRIYYINKWGLTEAILKLKKKYIIEFKKDK